jgi:hypothetical protein
MEAAGIGRDVLGGVAFAGVAEEGGVVPGVVASVLIPDETPPTRKSSASTAKYF